MGCLYLENEDQSCLLDNVDQGLIRNRQIDRALSWASIYWQYIAPGSTTLLAERGARILGYWPFTYVPLKRLRIQRQNVIFAVCKKCFHRGRRDTD